MAQNKSAPAKTPAMSTAGKMGVFGLAGIVVSSMIGGGIFSLPQNMAQSASIGAVLIAWLVTGFGMYFIANSFRILSMAKPNLTTGIYMYSKEGFGPYMGFTIGWSYWLCQVFGNVGYAVITMDALDYFFPGVFTGGNNLYSIIGGSILIWGFNFLVLRGMQQASVINLIATIAKMLPIFLFIIIMLFFFNIDKFDFDFWGQAIAGKVKSLGSVGTQVKSTMLVTLWAFIGIEGAVVLSNRARSQSDVGKATLMGFLGCLVIYVLLSIFTIRVHDTGRTGSGSGSVDGRCFGKSRRPVGCLVDEHRVDCRYVGQLAGLDDDYRTNAAIYGRRRRDAESFCQRKCSRFSVRFFVGHKLRHAAGHVVGLLFQQRVEHDVVHYGRYGVTCLFNKHGLLMENL